jgi:hypothetical protein
LFIMIFLKTCIKGGFFNNEKKRHNVTAPQKDLFTLPQVLIFSIFPIVFGLMGIGGIDTAQPVTAINNASCIFLVVLACAFTFYTRAKGIPYSKLLEDTILVISLFFMLLHLNIPSLYLVRDHLFWFFLLLLVWLITLSTVAIVYLRANDKITTLGYGKIKKYYYRFFLWVGVISFFAFIFATMGYNRVRSQNEDIEPPAVFFFGEVTGGMVIMLSFSIAMTIIYGLGFFMTSERNGMKEKEVKSA